MATEPKKAKKQLGEISICADCWFGVFHFVSPLELGLKIALLSGRFDGLVDEHFKTRKWALGFLEICRLSTGKRPVISKKFGIDQLRIRRIPQAPLPDNIIGFESIRISYINRTVVEFLCRIRRLFDSTAGTNLYILTASGAPHVFQKKKYRKSTAMIRQHIWPLVQGTVRSLFLSAFIFDNLRQLSPSVLTDCCASLRTIDSFELFPVWPASDAKFSRGQAIAKWLITPCPDGAPKVLNCGCSSKQLIRLKEAFLNASSPANFILFMLCSSSFNTIWPFELINNLTGERMKMKQIGVDNKFHLVRCPIARDEKKWAEWEEAAIEWEWNEQWNCIVIGFNGSDGIGKDLL